MSRSTQYIGLHKKAEEMVEGLDPVVDSQNVTHGMFGEDVLLDEWHDGKGGFIREVVQVEPWSSGPMIFTCLSRCKDKAEWLEEENDYGLEDCHRVVETKNCKVIKESRWKYDKSLLRYSGNGEEYDREKGTYGV